MKTFALAEANAAGGFFTELLKNAGEIISKAGATGLTLLALAIIVFGLLTWRLSEGTSVRAKLLIFFAVFLGVVVVGTAGKISNGELRFATNINGTVGAFGNLLTMLKQIRDDLGVQINVICHSEGNYMLMLAIAAEPADEQPLFNQALLAAADINNGALQQTGSLPDAGPRPSDFEPFKPGDDL